jgi:hypothetical protein
MPPIGTPPFSDPNGLLEAFPLMSSPALARS